MAETQLGARQVFKWMFTVLFGNVTKKDKDFMGVLQENFDGGRVLSEVISLTEDKKILS